LTEYADLQCSTANRLIDMANKPGEADSQYNSDTWLWSR
jgi:hypothetical protein